MFLSVPVTDTHTFSTTTLPNVPRKTPLEKPNTARVIELSGRFGWIFLPHRDPM